MGGQIREAMELLREAVRLLREIRESLMRESNGR